MSDKTLSIVAAAMIVVIGHLVAPDDDGVPMKAGAPNPGTVGWVTKSDVVALDDGELMSAMNVMVQVSEPVIRSSDGQTARVVNVHASFGVSRVILTERSIATSKLVDDGDPITFVHEKPEVALAGHYAGAVLGVPVEVPREEPAQDDVLVSIGPVSGTWGQVGGAADLEVLVVPDR